MKTKITLVFLLWSVISFSQTIPNPGFETWSEQNLWSDPVPYQTLNVPSYYNNGTASTQRSTASHGGEYAAFMQAQGTLGMADIGAVYLGDPGSVGFDNPLPFSGRPDSLVFWLNYNIDDGDLANVVIMLLKDGVQVGNTLITISGTSEDYERFSSPIAYLNAEIPNQMGFAAYSTSQFNPNPSSSMYLDDVAVVYNEGQGDQIPGGDFEIWNESNVTNPDGWASSNVFTLPNVSVTPSSFAYTGEFSARIESMPLGFDPASNYGFVILQDLFSDNCGEGEIDLFEIYIPYKVFGYYMYTASKASDDSASVYFSYDKYDLTGPGCTNILQYVFFLPPVNEWTYFEVEMPYEVYSQWCFSENQPQFFSLGFASTKINLDEGPKGLAGGVLFIDDLQMDYESCWSVLESEQNQIRVYPNPATNYLTVQSQGAIFTEFQILDVTGKMIRSIKSVGSNQRIDVSDLPQGLYTLRALAMDEVTCKSFVKTE